MAEVIWTQIRETAKPTFGGTDPDPLEGWQLTTVEPQLCAAHLVNVSSSPSSKTFLTKASGGRCHPNVGSYHIDSCFLLTPRCGFPTF